MTTTITPILAPPTDAESTRLLEDARRQRNWKRWGPYLSARQWGTVREDYSADGDAWGYLPHDHARSRAYRWGEDGLLGICDRECRVCFAPALWNGKDPILKERLFGLTGPEGNHGEDVKEHYFYLDSTPTHSYLKALYKYPQAEFPYSRLVEENRRRTRAEPEFELADTGVFDGSRYFDVEVEYAKAAPDDVLIRISVTNRGPERAPVHVLPTLWCRNSWSWGCVGESCEPKPWMGLTGPARASVRQATLGLMHLDIDEPAPAWLFTENETNTQRLCGTPNASAHVKDSFHECLIGGKADAVNPRREGTKAAAHLAWTLEPGQSRVVRLRLRSEAEAAAPPFGDAFEAVFAARRAEADAFYAARGLASLPEPERSVARQAYAGLLWSKQFYHYVVKEWLAGDPAQPPPPAPRRTGRNSDWEHLFNRDVLLMPDTWEYPWYAAWDLAFHCVAVARVDAELAKSQLLMVLREWYMHPNGQLPAYEFALGDVNPPVHAWACWRVYKMTAPDGKRDRLFLARAFQKLLLNFTWWVNRKDPRGRHLFAGGFLGLDNIGVFDRNRPLPVGADGAQGYLEQADGTAWMAFFCGTMLSMALELARDDPAYEDLASKFFEHFVAIADAMNQLGGSGLYDAADGFYYDQAIVDGRAIPLRVRSLVGVIPLLAAGVLEERVIDQLPGFKKRMRWFLDNRRDLARHISYLDADPDPADHEPGPGGAPHAHRLLAIPSRERLLSVLRYLLDESEFLSPFGVRSLSKVHERAPYVLTLGGEEFRVDYTPGESTTSVFGGNSNWRGPVWFPLNYLVIEALERYHHFYGSSLTVECPTGSGTRMDLARVAAELRARLARLFLPGAAGRRPFALGDRLLEADPSCSELWLFHEHFHAETGRGLGASHQTGWTALIAQVLLDRSG